MKHCTSCGRVNEVDGQFCEAFGQLLGSGSVGHASQSVMQTGAPPTDAHRPELNVVEAKGLIRALFDFGFHSLVTTRIIRIVYVVLTVLYSLGAVIDLIFAVRYGGALVLLQASFSFRSAI